MCVYVLCSYKYTHIQLGVGDMAKISYSVFFLNITILRFYHDSLSCWSEQYSQTNFPIIKKNPFKVTKYKKKTGGYLGQSGPI